MITNLQIKNFKSLKDVKFPCKKLNVFIGEPNSGKSNIIEALCMQSQNSIDSGLSRSMFRYKNVGDLFFDFDINNPVSVITNEKESQLKYGFTKNNLPDNRYHFFPDLVAFQDDPIILEHDGKLNTSSNSVGKTNVRFYEYRRPEVFQNSFMPHLSVPHGDNLPGLLLSNSKLKKWTSEFFKNKGFNLTFKPVDMDVLISKVVNDEIYSYPYFTVSETMQRIVFYSLAIKSNENGVLLFDEPESNTFPTYTKMLAERIAFDETNQFFITTHSPYLLLSMIEKAKSSEINVCMVKMTDYKTGVSILDDSQISMLLDYNSDIFFNFDNLLEK